MSNFNFYINVDQCLNMSNFEMFFYKLQSEHKFHLSNVQFFEDEGEQSLKKAFYEIRNYIDKSSFFVRDYRLIFGMRENRKKSAEIRWKDTILYRLFKIYFELKDARIFIKSKDSVDKSVSLIMLYDADFTFEEKEIERENYDVSEDIEILMNYLGINWREGISDQALEDRFIEILENVDGAYHLDTVTKRLLQAYVSWYQPLTTKETVDEMLLYEQEVEEQEFIEQEFAYQAYAQEDPKRYLSMDRQRNQPNIYNQLSHLFTFTQECVGHYCVFRKEINKNSMAENLLSLLSIVDYITSDFKVENSDEKVRSNSSLREQSTKNWERATNDTGIQMRYGLMVMNYKNRLQTELNDLDQKLEHLKQGELAPEYEKPETVAGTKGILIKGKKEYTDEFHSILNQFVKNSIRKNVAESSWNKAYSELKEKLNMMDEELQIFARDLSRQYKYQLEERKKERLKQNIEVVYSQESLSEEMERDLRIKEKLLSLLRKPQMNPSLTFQDQLNLENSLDQCNLEVTFYIKCYKMIQVINFLIFILAGGGAFVLHYFLMQSYALGDSMMMIAMLSYILAVFVLMLTCWNAPYFYFRKKIRKTLDYLKDQMERFIQGYFEKAENFTEYVNTINQLDAINVHIDKIQKFQNKYAVKARKSLWHKVQIKEHIRKSGYFENMIFTLTPEEIEQCISEECALNIHEDVVNNRIYWPQYGCKIQEVEK